MTERQRETYILIDEEEAEAQREIALDPDAPEWTEEDWERARPTIEVDPELVAWSRRTRGKQKGPHRRARFHKAGTPTSSHTSALAAKAGKLASTIPSAGPYSDDSPRRFSGEPFPELVRLLTLGQSE